MYTVLKFINQNIKEKLSLDELADMAGYSKWHFCRLFREYTGKSLTEYVRNKRIQLALLDVLKGKKVVDIAFDYGYDSVHGFIHAFVKEYGCFPMVYKTINEKEKQKYKTRRENMYKLTDRVSELRKAAVNYESYDLIVMQREFYYMQAIAQLPKNNINMMDWVSYGVAGVLKNSTPVIFSGELLVGYNYADDWGVYGSVETIKEKLKNSLLGPNVAEEYLQNLNTVQKRMPCPNWEDALSPEHKVLIMDEIALQMGGSVGSSTDNHSVIGYERMLTLGVDGLKSLIKDCRAKNGDKPLYIACERVLEAFSIYIDAYAEEAKKQAETEEDDIRKKELFVIVNNCKNIAHEPPSSFHEALQLLLFSHYLNTFEDYINANSLGRLDQILYPYYERDVKAGRLTKEMAFELICCLWIKLYRGYDVQQSCVGGTDKYGKSAVNELSYMMLDATYELDFIRCLSVRYSSKTEKEFLVRALEVVGHLQKGVPFFFNDEVMIPALESVGISHEDACDYTQIGCVETVVPGKHNPHAVSIRCNFLKAMEYALGNGKSLMYKDNRAGLQTGELATFKTYEEFENAVKQQVRYLLEQSIIIHNNKMKNDKYCPKPVKSMLTEGCLESGRDFNDKGAKYDSYEVSMAGIPNLADSLMAIKKFVYELNRYTLEEIKTACEENFPDETMRLQLLNKAPKYGNDIDEVDAIASDIITYLCDLLVEFGEKYDLTFHAQPFSFLWMVLFGRNTSATPDGRKKGENLAYSMSPMEGRDFNGFTALINSLCKLPTLRTPGTTSAIVEVDPQLFTVVNIPKFADIMLAAASNGLSNIQFNTIDVETLIDAQRNPENHKNLAVRVSGFSQRFDYLDKDMQDHIIKRTKHRSM